MRRSTKSILVAAAVIAFVGAVSTLIFAGVLLKKEEQVGEEIQQYREKMSGVDRELFEGDSEVDTSKWNTYNNVDYDYRFEYPLSWFIHSSGFEPLPPEASFVANIQETSLTVGSDYAYFQVTAINSLGETLNSYDEIEGFVRDGYSKSNVLLSGQDAVKLVGGSDYPDTAGLVYTMCGETMYRIVWGATDEEVLDREEDVLQAIVESVDFSGRCEADEDEEESADDSAETSDGISDEDFWSGNIYEGPVEPGDTAEWQDNADSGTVTWRLEILEVAQTRAPDFGFDDGDEFSIVDEYFSSDYGVNIAEVEVVHIDSGESYTMFLKQPETQGDGGIWVLYWISKE